MKKIITIIAAFAACATLTACGSTPKNSVSCSISQKTVTFSELKLKQAGIADRAVFFTLDELEKSSHIAVVGKFIGDAEQEVKYEYEPFLKKRSSPILPLQTLLRLQGF